MKKVMLTLCLLTLMSVQLQAQVKVQNLVTESQTNPIGLDNTTPRFSWKLHATKRNVMQTAYEIRAGKDAVKLVKGLDVLWQTGSVKSDQSVDVPYLGPALSSRQRVYWQVRVTDNSGKVSPWSEVNFFEMGLLRPADWSAQWIESTAADDAVMGPTVRFRKPFSISKKVSAARLYVTAHGLYELHLNGKRVGDGYLTPGWTSYKKRLQYQVYDVTSLLVSGNNAIGAELASGWFRGYLAWEDNKNIYGSKVALLLQLEITYDDGTTERIQTNEKWKCSTQGPVRSSEIYHGERYDARLEQVNWTSHSYVDSEWLPVRIADHSKEILIATEGPLVKKREVFKPIKIFTTPKGEKVIDFGQNLVGWIQLNVSAPAGQKITIQHAEVLDKYGNFYTDNLRAAKQILEYTSSGEGQESYEPHFTFYGFRYIKVDGFPGELKPENISAVAVYSDMNVTGTFTSSNALLNQLQHNIQWGQRGNFLDVPTDCPQRDERLGWTGDAQAFSRTAAFNFDVRTFFSKWLKDVEADQVDGSVPFVVPNVLSVGASGSAGWADAATIIPWNMYLAYGDKNVLENQYESMKAWIGFMERNSADYLWNKGFHFGDWLFYRPFDDNDGRAAVTDKYLIAQCFFAHSTELVLKTAKVLGKSDDVKRYSELLKQIKDAFIKEYSTPNGRLVSSTQTAYVLALNFDMLPESLRAQAAQKLVDNIKSYGNHLTTGFLGTPYLCHVLSRFGYTDVAYSLLMQETYPSWLYPVKMGATTIWERWDGIKPDSTFQTPGMNSFNHYAYGAIGDWMYRVVAGIDTDESKPGYKAIVIKPHIGGGLTTAQATLETPYGEAKSAWKLSNGKITLEIKVPVNTTAKVFVPVTSDAAVWEGGKPIASNSGIKVLSREDGYSVLEVGSGQYVFTTP
ncbi:MAG: glycoside hydrolase family 78 protein [Cyclobacteriaceae bacterium]|nr:glycoside hydrolase family 78 protein [Cyclobacteriaceae bacterium]